MRVRTMSVVSCAIGAVFVCGGQALRAADPVHERHEAMEAIGEAMKPLAAIAKKEAAFDAAVVATHAATIADRLKAASTLFLEGTAAGESRAKPEIWTDRDAFDKAMNDAQSAALALRSVKDEAGFGPAFTAVGVSCRSCHDKYRLPKR